MSAAVDPRDLIPDAERVSPHDKLVAIRSKKKAAELVGRKVAYRAVVPEADNAVVLKAGILEDVSPEGGMVIRCLGPKGGTLTGVPYAVNRTAVVSLIEPGRRGVTIK